MAKPGYLVFDIESVSDGRLLQRVRYPEEPELTPAAAIAKQRAELMERTGSDFIPHTFQMPVSVAICKVGGDFELQDLVSIDRPHFRPQVISRKFWQGWVSYGQPTFVTFNGRCFDLPVMEMMAFRYGIPVPQWFINTGPSYQQPRNRYNSNAHLDLQDLMTNFSAVRQNGGLDLLANVLGKPGKMGTKGYMVQDLWEAGEHQRIDDYCLCDALDTYFVFLRCMVMMGRLDIEQEQSCVANARIMIERKAEHIPALGEYLQQFGTWRAVGDDDWPFVEPADASLE